MVGTYQVQYLDGSIWQISTFNILSEQSALVIGQDKAKNNPKRKYRIVYVEGNKKSVVHIF